MGSIIVALPQTSNAKQISDILKHRGMETAVICTTGASVLSQLHQLSHGIVICGNRFTDMHYTELLEYLPERFEMLLMASPAVVENSPPGLMTLTYPIKPSDLANTVDMMLTQQNRKIRKQKMPSRKRTEQEQNYINNAKWVLMERNHMTEQEAFRYIQKCSMDSGTNMVETAQMILLMICDS